MKNKIFLILALITVLFTSCTNVFENTLKEEPAQNAPAFETSVPVQPTQPAQAVKYANVSGNILLEGAYPAVVSTGSTTGVDSAFRTAFPTTPSLSNLTLYVSAVNVDNEDDKISGTISSDNTYYTISIPVSNPNKTYEIKIKANIETAFYKTLCMSGTSEEFTISDEALIVAKDVTLNAISDEGMGALSLDVKADSETGINSARIVYTDNQDEQKIITAVKNNDTFKFLYGNANGLVSTGIASGSYLMSFEFYSATDCTGELLYAFRQTVNIFNQLETNIWVKNGSEPYLDNTGLTTICKITKSMVTGFVLTQIYIDSGRQTTDPTQESTYTTGSGTFLNPVTSFDAAIAKLQDSTKDYTIHIKGSIQGGFELPESLDTRMNSLQIKGASPLEDGKPKDKMYGYAESIDEIKSEYDFKKIRIYNGYHIQWKELGQIKPVLTISTEKPVSITNLEISNGLTESGGGLYISKGQVTLNRGVLVTKNKTGTTGGGITVLNGAILIIDGAIISENSVYDTNDNHFAYGGGLCILNGGTVKLISGEICSNLTSNLGGGVASIRTDNTANPNVFIMIGGRIHSNKANGRNSSDHSISGYAGGVYLNDGSFTMSGGEITENSANAEVAGVDVGYFDSDYECSFTMTGGIIKDNTAIEKGKPYAIRVNNKSKLYLGGDAYIPSGEDGKHDIYLDHYQNSDACITLVSSLSRHSENDQIKVTPEQAEPGLPVVMADGTTVTDLRSDKNCFILSDENAELRFLSGDYTKLILDRPIFVRYSGTIGASADGSKSKPFGSIMDACSAITDSNIDYTIYIDALTAPLSGDQNIPQSVSANSITILGYNGLYPAGHEKAGQPKDVIDTGNVIAPALSISCACDVFLGSIKISGSRNYGSPGNDGGGVRREHGKLYIMDGTLISGNVADNGAGVYLNDASLYMSGGKICQNETSTSGGGNGGGIYVTGGSVFLYGNAVVGGISSSDANVAHSCGAGIYLNNGSKLYLGYKAASGSDGEPQAEDEAELTGGILGNYCDGEYNSSGFGGGVYMDESSKLYMNSGTIGSNRCEKDGGGVYLAPGAEVKMSGGAISGNEAVANGGGIYNIGKVFLYGSAVIGETGERITDVSENSTNKPSNKATSHNGCGGGIYNYSDTDKGTGILYMGYKAASGSNGTPVSSNTAEWTGGIYRNYAGTGGGIDNCGLIYMNTGSITGNYANYGGGLHHNGSTANTKFYMTGGLISENSSSESGSGILLGSCEFYMSGPACVLPDSNGGNDIYMVSTNNTIIIADSINPTKNGKTSGALAEAAAAISLPTYEANRAVLSKGIDVEDSAFLAACKKFKINQPVSDDRNWTINDEGENAGKLLTTIGTTY